MGGFRNSMLRAAWRNGGWAGFAVLTVSLALMAFGLTLRLADIDLFAPGPEYSDASSLPVAGPRDRLEARFVPCGDGNHERCVVDGDTIWFAGEKIRVLDINAPEISTPRCQRELVLGQAAAARLTELLNMGRFSLETGPELTDRYGRSLRRITRGRRSVGDILVAEGLAEPWQGFRRNWC